MRAQDEIVKDIKTVLEEKVAPSVAAHNGSIGFISFASDTGVATLKLSGSCSGCAMSKITLQRGVEQTLKHYVPEVKSIVGEDDEQAAEQGYDPYFPKDKEPDWERLVRKSDADSSLQNNNGVSRRIFILGSLSRVRMIKYVTLFIGMSLGLLIGFSVYHYFFMEKFSCCGVYG